MLAKLIDTSDHGLGLKNWLELTLAETKYDAMLTGLIAAVSEAFAGACNRLLERVVDYVEIFDGGMEHLSLAAYPIESVASIKESSTGNFSDVESLVENSDYFIKSKSGLIYRAGNARWLSGRNTVQGIYTAGYLDPATTPVPAGAIVMPEDIQFQVLQQCRFLWMRRKDLGISSTGVSGASWQIQNNDEWLPPVKACINRYLRR